ncbi:hypothetical protein GA707_17190 [Nostocoides sp. F2B08]|nr:hypothetical protein GA707_17190 [Tetrasphaera sp. F2B08]
MCPVRPGDHCTLCVPGATGPHDCGLVYLVMDDPDLATELATRRAEVRRSGLLARPGAASA